MNQNWNFSLKLLVDSSSYLWLVNSGRVARGFECSVHGFEHNFLTWRVLQGSSALERDLTDVIWLLRFPVCVIWYQSYGYFPMMVGDNDELQSLSARMGTVRRRGNTIKGMSLRIDDRTLTDGTYRNGHDLRSFTISTAISTTTSSTTTTPSTIKISSTTSSIYWIFLWGEITHLSVQWLWRR